MSEVAQTGEARRRGDAPRAKALTAMPSLLRFQTLAPPRSVLALAGLALLFLGALILVGGFQFSDEMLPAFWANLDYRALEPKWQYLSGNALYNLLGHLISRANGAELSVDQFHLVGMGVVAACYIILFTSSVVRFGVERAGIFLACVALTTLDSTQLHWIGKADPLFVCAYLVLFFGRTNIWLTALGVALLLGVHREQASVVLVLHVLILILERRLTFRLVLGIVGGFAVGFIALQIYSQLLGLDGARGRLEYALRDNASVITYSLKFVLKWIGLALPSVLLGGWWLALNLMKDVRSAILLLLAIGGATLVAATTHDFTRGASLMVMPVTFYLAEVYARQWRPGDGLQIKWAALLAFVALIGYEVQDNRILPFHRPFMSLDNTGSVSTLD